MPALLIYLLKANIALTLFFLAYRWGLRRLTFYVLNRFFLLAGIVCSSIFPLVDVNNLLESHQKIEEVVAYVPDLGALQAQPAAGFTWWHLLVYIFWTGVVVMAIRFMVQLSALWRIHRTSQRGLLQQHPVKLLHSRINPFSFFRHIYINPSLHQPAELDAILRHELVHVKEWHTVDVLTAELNNIFYWFNPGAWLMKAAIRENLEFITDRRMLQQGADPKAYQYNLIKVSGIPYATAIANNFNFSHLKNRIKMMNQKRSAKYNLLRYLVLGGVVATALLSLNFSRAAFHGKQLTVVADTVPAPPAPVTAPAPVAPTNPDQVVPATPPVPAGPGNVPAPPPPPPRVPAPSGKHATPPPPPPSPQKVVTLDVPSSDPATAPLYVLDGVKQGRTMPMQVDKNDIDAINVLKYDHALNRYGEEGRNGVIEIYTKGYKGAKPDAGVSRTYPGKEVQLRADTAIQAAFTLRGVDSSHQPLFLIDGVAASPTAVNTLQKDKITSIEVLKSSDAISIYGSKGANGVINVKTIEGTK